MAKKRRSKKSQKQMKKIISLILGLIVVVAVGFFGVESGIIGGESSLVPLVDDEHAFSLHMIDMGQGDSLLLSKDGKYALIDAGETMSPGERESREAIFAYLDSLGVKKLEFLLLTQRCSLTTLSSPRVSLSLLSRAEIAEKRRGRRCAAYPSTAPKDT